MATNIIPCTIEEININQWGQGGIKFSDGTMMVMTTQSVTSSSSGGKPYSKNGSANYNWPSAAGDFIDDNIAVFTSNSAGEIQNYNQTITNVTKTGYTLTMGATATHEMWPRIFAIGRWKDSTQSIVYSFTGSSKYFQENYNDWHLALYTDGSLTINKANTSAFDIFCIGGGGGGGSAMENHGYGGGGGGGYGALVTNQALSLNTAYSVTIGQGGTGGKYGGGYNTAGGDGGTSSFGSIVSANGGKGALGVYGETNIGGIGGNNGGNGNTSGSTSGTDGSYGSLSTKYFQETDGADYAGGGGGAGNFAKDAGIGHAGGGNGGDKDHPVGYSATPNTGGGGGGASEYYGHHNGGDGGSGVIIIRNHRE